jgi:excisionase family DNA binding protein
VPDDELLTPAEVARMFRVNPKTVTRWAQSGKLRSVRTLGGRLRFYRSDIERAIEAGGADGPDSLGNG